MLALVGLNPEICSVLGSKNIHRRKTERKKCVRVVDGGWVVYMGGYSIAPESLRAHKSYVFVKQQKLRKREGGYGRRRGEVMISTRPSDDCGAQEEEERYKQGVNNAR